MKKTKMFFAAAIFICLFSSMALANGLNLNSLGSRALAMGGAFVGLADDFSAIYWNPAGIIQFKRKYFGFYATDIIPSGTYERTEVPAFEADTPALPHVCPSCGADYSRRMSRLSPIRAFRTGLNKMLQVLAINFMEDLGTGQSRKLVAFSDSRAAG